MAYPTRAHCLTCADYDALFVWDVTQRKWKCNTCKTPKQRAQVIQLNPSDFASTRPRHKRRFPVEAEPAYVREGDADSTSALDDDDT